MTEPASFAARLLGWFDRHRRDLPWRRTRDPWAIWVSEVMLQQTRVEAVREPFARFLARFPTPADFAAAADDELLLAWKGLGYYRRARLLREGARAVVRDHGGAVPDEPTTLGGLPGIGDYTRGAIASIAFGRRESAVDGNVERVLARHAAIEADVKTAAARRRIAALAGDRQDPARPGDFNQALMELGATVCTPTSPRCTECPVAADCMGRRRGAQERLPVRKPPRAPVQVTSRVALALAPGKALGARVPAGEPNSGQVELPGAGILVGVEAADLAVAVRRRHGADLDIGGAVARVRHAITHHRIELHAHAASVRTAGRLHWFPLDASTPWTTPARKVFARALAVEA